MKYGAKMTTSKKCFTGGGMLHNSHSIYITRMCQERLPTVLHITPTVIK